MEEKLGCDSGNNQDENNLGVAKFLVVIMVISQENVQFGVIRRNKSSQNLMIILYSATSKSHHSLLSTPAYYKYGRKFPIAKLYKKIIGCQVKKSKF